MTTPSTARKAGPLLGNGSTTAFPFTFKVFAAADVAVTIANSSGVETPLVLNTDYSVALNSNQDTSPGGTITYPISGAALPSGSKLSIVGDIDYDQPLDLPSGGNFSPLALENQLDRATMQIQQLAEGLSRAAQLPVTNSEDPATLVADIVRLADSADNIDTLVANLADITTVADDLNEPVSEINTVAGAITNVNNVGNNIANVNTVAGISANVTTVAAIDDDVTAVAGVAANVTTVAGVSAAVTAVAAIDDDVTIAAANVADITNFADVYQGPKASDPTLRNDGNALQAGDLYFNTTEDALRAYSGTQWVAGTAGTVSVQTFSGDGSTTAFALASAPAGENNTQVFISGVYQQKDQYSVSGTTLTFASAPPSGTDNIEVVTIATLALGQTDSALSAFVQAGTGAVPRTVQAELRDRVSAKQFGVVGDGSNEATKIQAAINHANSLGGFVELIFEPGKTYVTGGLVPKSGVLLNLQGSTLKLRDAGLTPIVFDGGVAGGGGNNFGVINGTLDCNQVANNSINVVGGVWLTNWTNLRFQNLTIKNCYRQGLNLIGCSYLTVHDYQFVDSGIAGIVTPGIPNFAYALNVEKGSGTSRYISVKNVTVSNVVGFGVHFFGCEDFEATNFDFSNLTYGANLAIAITFTQAKRGTCNNVKCTLVNGDNIEINGCTDLTLENYEINQAGNRPLLTGGADYGYNKRVRVRNFADTSTSGAFSAALNYLTDCELEGLNLSKQISVLTGLSLARNNIVRNSFVNSTVSASPGLVAYGYFKLENVRFTDYTFRQFNDQGSVVSGVQTMAIGAVLDLPIASIVSTTFFNGQGVVAGTLRTLTRFTGSFNQGTYQTCEFLVNNFGTAANLSTVTRLDSAIARALTIAGDAANKKLTLTNGSGVELSVSWTLQLVTIL